MPKRLQKVPNPGDDLDYEARMSAEQLSFETYVEELETALRDILMLTKNSRIIAICFDVLRIKDE